ncbi:VOC family protein [Amycolatopsis japonica]|uniref:VOC family protein n=1 Tax=Amycolatopsis japonica TaxID=208439 RepID=UPI00332BB515
MPTTKQAFSGMSVNDLQKAQKFYGGTLGFEVTKKFGQLHVHLPGGHKVLIYRKPDHRPATYTALYLPVGDVDEAVDELTARGVVFERYTKPRTDEKGIFRGRGPDIAWFTDPDGNVIAVVEER